MILLSASAMILSFAACGNAVPDGMAQDTYDAGVKALEIMDKYNNADINEEEADNRLDALCDKLESLELSDETESGYGLSEADYNDNVQIHISYFQYQLFDDGDTYSAADTLRETLELD